MARNVNDQSRTVSVPANAIRKINDIHIQERILMNDIGQCPNDEELAERAGMIVTKLNFCRRSAEDVSNLDRSIDTWKGKEGMSTDGNGGDASMDALVRDTEHPGVTTRLTPTASASTSFSSSRRGNFS